MGGPELSVEPGSVEEGGTVRVTVRGKGIGEWRVGIFSEGGAVKSVPTPLDAYGPPVDRGGGDPLYTFTVRTIGYAPGEHRVSVSPGGDPVGRGVRIKKFAVTARAPMVVGQGSGGRYGFGLEKAEWRL